jgi:hypothetical protein
MYYYLKIYGKVILMDRIRKIVRTLIMEICVDSLEFTCNAESGGADRIEPCANTSSL